MFRKIAILLSVLALGLLGGADPATAAASRLSVKQSVTIAAPSDKVWGIVKNFSDMSWHPAVKSDTATNGNSVGSVRTLDLGGPKLIEQLTAYSDAKMRYSYKITDDPANVKTLPVTRYTSTISVRGTAKGTSVVTWTGSFRRADPNDPPAAGQDDATATNAVTGVYKGGLDNLKKLAETPAQ
jgi:hypothetical protein